VSRRKIVKLTYLLPFLFFLRVDGFSSLLLSAHFALTPQLHPHRLIMKRVSQLFALVGEVLRLMQQFVSLLLSCHGFPHSKSQAALVQGLICCNPHSCEHVSGLSQGTSSLILASSRNLRNRSPLSGQSIVTCRINSSDLHVIKSPSRGYRIPKHWA